MHDSPPPYPGINPSYQPSYPAQPNGPQAPQMGFAGAPQPPSYPGGSAGFPQAPGSSYPNLPPNGFNGGFQQSGPSAPPSKLKKLLVFEIFLEKFPISCEVLLCDTFEITSRQPSFRLLPELRTNLKIYSFLKY
jgi:hypothetical protein